VLPPEEVPEVEELVPSCPLVLPAEVVDVPVVVVPVVPVPVVLEEEIPVLLVTPLDEAPVVPESDGFPLPEELLPREATGMFWSTQPATDAATARVANTSPILSTASILTIPSAPPSNVQSIIPSPTWKALLHARRAGIA
jgi:hypothetical protein